MFGDILRNVGNFVGGLFGGNKDDEERKRRQQQQSTPQSTVRQPNIGFNPQSAPLTLSNQQDNRPTVQQPVNILQKRDTPQHSGSIFDIAKPISEGGLNPLADAGKWAENNLVKPIAEQGVKAYNTLQAPVTGLVGEGMATADRVFNQGRNADNILQATKKQMDDQLRKSYVTPEVASGRANPLEFGKQFAQTGIELAPYAVGAPEFKAAADGAVGVLPALSRTTNELVGKASSKVPSILAPVARNMTSAALVDAPLFAGLDTASQAMDGKFDPAHALQSALMATLIGGTVPRGLAPTRGGRNLLRGEVERTAEKGITGERPVVQEPPTVKPTSDPNSPISAPTRPVPKEPAITSPNRPATPPPVAEPIAPPRVMAESTTPPQILSRPANSNALPPEPLTPAPIPEPIQAQKQAIQKAIEEQKLQAPPENPLPTPATLEMPKQAQARAIAEQSTPINQEAVQASEKTRAVNDAPTEAMKKEAMKYGTAEEFVRANQSSPEIRAAEAKLAEIKARPDYQDFTKGGKITGKTWNDNNAAGVEYRNAVDARSKQLTDLYNQAHAEAKVKTSEPAKSPPTEAIAKSVEDELSGRLRSRVMSSFGSKEYRNAIHEAYVKLPEEYKNWIENFSHRSRSITQQDEAILHPERYMDLYKRETSPVSLNLAERLPTSKLAETPSPTPRTLDDVMAEVNKLDDTDPTNAKHLQELSDEFDKLAETKEIPAYKQPTKNGKASVPGTQSVHYNTGDTNLDGIIHDSIIAHKGTAGTAEMRGEALDKIGVDSSMRAKIRNISVKNVDKQTGRISDNGVEQIRKILRGETDTPPPTKLVENTVSPQSSGPIPPAAHNPTPPSDGELGKVAREAILDGSITTKEGQAEVIRKTTELANREAEQAGTTIDDIIRKGQETWEKSQLAKHDLSPSEVANGAKTPDGKAIKPVEGFTPEQQSIYQRYSQELSTVRNRTEVALKEGDQGAWYSPRQYLDDMGNAPEYNPELINERKRNNSAKTNSEGNPLDYSTRQHEDYLRRYMTAEDAGAKRLVDAVELHSETGEPTGIKLSDKSKTNLEKGMQKVVEKRDEGLKLQAKGDSLGAEKVARQVQKEIDKTINRLIADIPNGPGRKAAIDQIKVLRGTYMQSTVQTLALSNIVNRVFDQGARAVLGAQRPLTGFIEKRIAPLMNKKVMPGTEAFTLNTSKEARQAAKEMSKGTLKGEIVDNYRANTSMAGAGRNPFAKTFAKIDAHLRASGTALTQAGDISTQVARRTFELGASRPEAQGLKTVADYKKYMADYMNSKNFKTDLASAESDLMNRIGLSGSAGDNMAHAGKFSRTVSKYLDNGVKTGVEALGQKFGVKGLGDKRIVQEIGDYWKVNGPGYAAVTTRVMNYVSNSLALGIPKVIKAVEQAGKGDAAASARATQIAAQSISDAVAVYGTIGASLVLAKIAPDVIGFTGAQPVSGSSDSAYNKSEQIPANQWYINLPGGNRLYIDPSRIGAPGVGANIAGGMQKGTVADTTANTLSQMANQVGGESLIDKYSTVKDAFANPSLSQSQREYAQKRVGSMAAPALGIANNIANLTDDKKRDSAGFTNTLQSRIPGLRQNVPVAKDARGNDIANTKQLSGGSGLVSVGKNTDSKEYQASDPVGTEIARLQKGNKDVFPTNANTNATDKNTQDLAGLLINDKAYKDADDTTKGKMMSSVLNGTDFKNVNTSISNDDKLALMHAKQQGDKKESWLDDNSNAVNYYRADYNNAKANGTLTDKDENLNEKTGKKYLMIGSQVDKDFGADQELKRLYESIGSSDIKNFFNRKSELYDPEMGDRLLAYDEARTNSGVSRNAKYSDKRKYDPTTAKGGGGSNGATVNLPSISKSLTGASDGPKFAEGKRLYNPPKALVAPDNKPYAKPPSISVKRGVHL